MWTYVDFELGKSGIMDETWMQEQGMYFPEISITPAKGKKGTTVTIEGSGFPDGANVTNLWFGGEPQTIPSTSVDTDGTFTLLFNVPEMMWGWEIGQGWYWIDIETFHQPTGRYDWAGDDFEVVPSGTTFTMWADPGWLGTIDFGSTRDTSIKVESWGEAVTADLSLGWIPYGLTADFVSDNGTLLGTTANVTVPAGGKSGITLRLNPVDMTPGWYSIEVKGVDRANPDSHMWTYVDFEVAPPSDFTDKDWMEEQGIWFPEIILNPTKAEPGKSVTVVGTDFPVGANVTHMRFAGEEQSIPDTTVDENGDFTLLFNVPINIGIGQYMVEVEAEAAGLPPVFIAKPFEVTSSTEVSFDLWVVPDWIDGIAQGSSGNITVNIEATSAETTVVLSVEGLPFGASAQFSSVNNTLTALPGGKSSATLTITTSTSTPPGQYPLSIEGVSDNDTRMVSFGFGVVMPADFGIPELTLDPGFAPAGYGDKKMKIAFSGNGFPANAAVYLAFAGANITLPSGFSTDNTGSFNGIFQLPTGLDPGTYMVAAMAGGKKDAKPFIIKAADSTFIINPSPPFLPPILQGTSANATVTVTSVATTNSTVTLSIDGLPAGVTASFSPSNIVTAPPGSSSSAIVNISVDIGTLPGMYPLSIRGISGNETISVPFGFGVMTDIGEGEGYATITINPPGGNPGTNITIAGAGFTDNETITLTAAPMGGVPIDFTSGNITVQTGGIWSSQMTIPPADQVPPGIYIIKATDGIVSAKAELHIAPEETGALTMDLSPSYLKVTQGISGNVSLKVNSQNAFKDTIRFGIGMLPLGVTATFTSGKGTTIGQFAGSPAGGRRTDR